MIPGARWLLAGLVACCIVRPASSQARPFVAPNDVVYRDIDHLAAAGLIDTLLVGARPFNEREVLRLLNEARRNLGRNPGARAWAESVIQHAAARFARGSNRWYDELQLDGAGAQPRPRPVSSDSNGTIEALIDPLAAYRGGRPLVDGATNAVESLHSALAGPHVAVKLNPRLTIASPRSERTTTQLWLQTGAATLTFGNYSIEIGRDYVIYGQAPEGGLLLSMNAPPFDMVKLTNDAPVTVPLISRLLGPFSGSAFVADLGPHQIHPHAKLIGYHVASLPHPRFELGVEVIDAMGGRTGQPASFGDRLLDVVPIFDVFRRNSDFQFSNKMAAVDAHWRAPSRAGLELYGQVAIDDFDARRLRSVLHEDAGYLAGAYWSCILDCGRLGVRAEYHQTGIRFYTHPDYPLAMNETLLGDPLGPRGTGGSITVDGEDGHGGHLEVTTTFEVRSGNGYGSTADDAYTHGFRFFQVYHRPAEKRGRVVGTWTGTVGGWPVLQLTGGAERVSNFGFVAGADRTNWLAAVAVTVTP